MRQSVCLIFFIVLLSCSTRSDNDFILSLKIKYSFYPGDEFVISKKGDSLNFEYRKLLNEIDSNFVINMDRKFTYWRSVERKDSSFFTIKTFKTDSLIYGSDLEFVKDSSSNQIMIKEKDITNWILVDSVEAPEIMQKVTRELDPNDIQKIRSLILSIKSKYKSSLDPCLDGSTTSLKYEQKGTLYEFENICRDLKELTELVEICRSIRDRDSSLN